jgi:hypothetical protein
VYVAAYLKHILSARFPSIERNRGVLLRAHQRPPRCPPRSAALEPCSKVRGLGSQVWVGMLAAVQSLWAEVSSCMRFGDQAGRTCRGRCHRYSSLPVRVGARGVCKFRQTELRCLCRNMKRVCTLRSVALRVTELAGGGVTARTLKIVIAGWMAASPEMIKVRCLLQGSRR